MARHTHRSRQGFAGLILYIQIERDLNFNYRHESALFADTNPTQGPEVPFGEVSSHSDVFQSQIVIHRVS